MYTTADGRAPPGAEENTCPSAENGSRQPSRKVLQ